MTSMIIYKDRIMSLQDVSVKNEYRSLIDNVVQEFYIHCWNRQRSTKSSRFLFFVLFVEITKE